MTYSIRFERKMTAFFRLFVNYFRELGFPDGHYLVIYHVPSFSSISSCLEIVCFCCLRILLEVIASTMFRSHQKEGNFFDKFLSFVIRASSLTFVIFRSIFPSR